MSASTLVVDDTQTLIETLSSTASRIGIKGAAFFTSLSEASKAAAMSSYKRYIADLVFEGETQTGLDFLEEVHSRQPDAELVLLTGKYISPQNRDRLSRIGASLVKKSHLDTDFFTLMLSPAPLPDKGLADGPEIDIAELRLQYDYLCRQFDDVKELNNLLVQDIMMELASVKAQGAPAVMIGGQLLSASDLRRELEGRTEIGRELIRLHHNLYRHLRAKY